MENRMSTIYYCIANAHDLRLVALAAVICLLASFSAISLLHHMRRSIGRWRLMWLAVSAISTGFGIWATHFIAMLAFTPGVPSAYNIALTFLSLIAAIFLTGAGLAAAVMSGAAIGPYLGGAMVGGGIAAMHYTGMAAFEIQGRIIWDPALVAVSILLGALLGAAALPVGLRTDSLKARVLGAVLLTLAICSHHFTAMGAATIIPDPTIELSAMALPSGKLAIAVASVSFVIIGLAFAGITVEMRTRRRNSEITRMRTLANAAVEGLLVCKGQGIVTANESFADLAGLSPDSISGMSLEHFFPDGITRLKLMECSSPPVESDLRKPDGSRIPVELITRPIDFFGKPHTIIAIRDLRERKQAEQLRYLAQYDALTGISNRNTFTKKLDEEIELALAAGQQLAVLCLDLDRFKEVNDLYGHSVGDKMLQAFAQCVSGVLDSSQMIARLGGDEFAIIAPKIYGPATASRIAENILEAVRTNNNSSETEGFVSASIGIAFCPGDATDRHELLSNADAALYHSKNEGRAMYQFYKPAMGTERRKRCLLEHDLRQASDRGEFRLVYQPIKNIQINKILGFEALLRWKHPTRGEVSPAEFIPLAEDTRVILHLGEWVLREACREAASWAEPLIVAVNVSAVQLHEANFSATVYDILCATGLAPSRLELEITETALVRDLDRALETLGKIKMLGVRVAMDDFGTGFSSLSNLRAFPFDKIKIDRSFVKSVHVNDQGAAIVRSVVGLSRALRLPVVAEGVETPAELAFLAGEACDVVQGYLVGKPNDIESFRDLTHPANGAERQGTVIPLMQNAASPDSRRAAS
jgi:diguanylate cyclase